MSAGMHSRRIKGMREKGINSVNEGMLGTVDNNQTSWMVDNGKIWIEGITAERNS